MAQMANLQGQALSPAKARVSPASNNIDGIGKKRYSQVENDSRNFMNVPLTPELEQLVVSKVKSGRYRSAGEVIREALRLLEMRDQVFTLHRDEVRAQIEEGWQAAKRGELADGDDVFDRMDAELESIQRSAPK